MTDQGENPDGERPTPEDGGDPDPAAARFEQFKLARAFEPRTDAPQRVKGLNSSSLVSAGVADSMAKLASSAVFTSGLADSVAKLASSPVFTSAVADLLAEIEVEGIGADASAVRLDRKQQRLICGYLAYVIVWLLVLQVMINMLGTDDALANVISLTTVMTGLSGHVIATLAKKTAFWAYDQLNPPVE